MPLLGRQQLETIGNRELAADDRFYDGLELAFANRGTAGVYLLGYCAEILLKNAYYKFRAVPATHVVSNVSAMMKALSFKLSGNSHDLQNWGNLLVTERAINGNPMDPAIAGTFLFHIQTLQSHWAATLRYSAVHANQTEISEVYSSVEWIKRNYINLWS